MADRDVVERAADLLNVSVGVMPARREGWRDAFCARIRGVPAVLWMQRLRPLMGSRRQAQIDRAIASHAPDPRRRLDDAAAREALERLAAGDSVRQVAEHFGASIWCIYDLRSGRTHAHLTREAA